MGLPNVKIDFANGVLGSVGQSADGVVGMVLATESTNSSSLDQPVCVYTSDCLTNLHIEEDSAAYKAIRDFYAEAGEGAELWLCMASSDEVEGMLSESKALLRSANGRIRTLVVVPTEGVDSGDIKKTAMSAQSLAESVTTELFAPVVVLLPMKFVPALPQVTTLGCHRVGLVVGDTVANSTTSMVGIVAGRVAKSAVHVHIGRVKDGALNVAQAYIGEDEVSQHDMLAQWFTNGYIVPRCFVGKSGYFFADDCLATSENDDYRSLARRRVIDKAYRVAYSALLEYVNDNLDVTAEGTLSAMAAKAIEQEVESKIYNSMTAEGNLSADGDGDTGVKVLVDTTNDVVATNKINVSIMVKPYGYAKYIEVELGFLKED